MSREFRAEVVNEGMDLAQPKHTKRLRGKEKATLLKAVLPKPPPSSVKNRVCLGVPGPFTNSGLCWVKQTKSVVVCTDCTPTANGHGSRPAYDRASYS